MQIGKFNIERFDLNDPMDTSLYIEIIDGESKGEGGQFPEKAIEELIEEYYRKHF